MRSSSHSGMRGRDSARSLLSAGRVRMRPLQRRASRPPRCHAVVKPRSPHPGFLRVSAARRSRIAREPSQPRKSGSHETPRWREMDSNPRSPIRRTTLFEGPPANLDPSRAACLGMLSAAHKMLIQGMFSNSRARSPHASPGSTLI